MSVYLKLTCPKHPQYAAIYRPRADCNGCRNLYALSHGKQICGPSEIETNRVTLVPRASA